MRQEEDLMIHKEATWGSLLRLLPGNSNSAAATPLSISHVHQLSDWPERLRRAR